MRTNQRSRPRRRLRHRLHNVSSQRCPRRFKLNLGEQRSQARDLREQQSVFVFISGVKRPLVIGSVRTDVDAGLNWTFERLTTSAWQHKRDNGDRWEVNDERPHWSRRVTMEAGCGGDGPVKRHVAANEQTDSCCVTPEQPQVKLIQLKLSSNIGGFKTVVRLENNDKKTLRIVTAESRENGDVKTKVRVEEEGTKIRRRYDEDTLKIR
ncbi:hypothetical protein F2P81_009759 [Scophthalmus maximus]|uniref:Uncharacterized protein n=1 Tax=Scophthalmus maximus TaxID=52904 RepID=A0A6A4SVZ5_SCOMX|nr:hypothetical protein F2P81_009759 [Scophthalmus maximus]